MENELPVVIPEPLVLPVEVEDPVVSVEDLSVYDDCSGNRGIQICCFGKGPTGPTGPAGPPGMAGPTGPMGPDNTVSTFIHVLATQPQILAVDESIVFDANPVLAGDCGFVPSSSDIWVWKSGYYYTSITIHHKEPGQFSLFKNNVFVVNGGIFTSSMANSHMTTTLLFQIEPSDMITETTLSPTGMACNLQLKNHISNTPTVSIMQSNPGRAPSSSVASLTLLLLM